MRDSAVLDANLERVFRIARIPGAAVAVVAHDETLFAKGYGYQDLDAKRPVTPTTTYPIASTTKAMNATLIGMLVDEGRLGWDAPIQRYIPQFRLHEQLTGAAGVTLRDLIVMRTGLPRHDFVWMSNPIDRAELMRCLAHFPASHGFREHFQYNNVTATIAGHVAEVVAGCNWETLIAKRLFEPLGMTNTGFEQMGPNETLSFHETRSRELVVTQRIGTEPIGPAGGSVHSNVVDMSRWLIFNLMGGVVAGRRLIGRDTLREIHSPCLLGGNDPGSPTPYASYGLGWFVDEYGGARRISHTGWLHDVNSCVMMFPEEGLGIVSFINFAGPRLAQYVNEITYDYFVGRTPKHSLEEKIAEYEKKVETARLRNSCVHRVPHTSPSHSSEDYVGTYVHPGYGAVEIVEHEKTLAFVRGELFFPLEHWHYDAWVIAENDFFEIHRQHCLERANRISFETDVDGQIAALHMQTEPGLPPFRFKKEVKSEATSPSGQNRGLDQNESLGLRLAE